MDVILRERFHEKLRSAMKILSVTQVKLAERIGCTQGMVSQYVRGDTCPGLEVAEKFAIALDLPPHALIDERSIEDHLLHHAEK